MDPVACELGIKRSTLAPHGGPRDEFALAIVVDPDQHAHQAVLLKHGPRANRREELEQDEVADAVKVDVALARVEADVDADEQRVVALRGVGLGPLRLVGQLRLQRLVEVGPGDAGLGEEVHVGLRGEVGEEGRVEGGVLFHEDVLAGLQGLVEFTAPEAGAGVHVEEVASAVPLEGVAHVIDDVVYIHLLVHTVPQKGASCALQLLRTTKILTHNVDAMLIALLGNLGGPPPALLHGQP